MNTVHGTRRQQPCLINLISIIYTKITEPCFYFESSLHETNRVMPDRAQTSSDGIHPLTNGACAPAYDIWLSRLKEFSPQLAEFSLHAEKPTPNLKYLGFACWNTGAFMAEWSMLFVFIQQEPNDAENSTERAGHRIEHIRPAPFFVSVKSYNFKSFDAAPVALTLNTSA